MKASSSRSVIDGKEYQYNRTGYIIHDFTYQVRKNIQAIFYLYMPSIVYSSSFLSQNGYSY
ncbi:hypothetical protein GO684_04785 [Wolbachia endosymbiont of Litomosoides brasiliensis]|nr:hypothetical protein [Wolbachia endosymbiont of Litomosoides brasiliensis]NUY39910.1 hypothetical protein [Wolbachia endosymbiont of Litomosoides brasiliensis]